MVFVALVMFINQLRRQGTFGPETCELSESWASPAQPHPSSPQAVVLQWSVFNAHLSCVYTNFLTPQALPSSPTIASFCFVSRPVPRPGSLGIKFCVHWHPFRSALEWIPSS